MTTTSREHKHICKPITDYKQHIGRKSQAVGSTDTSTAHRTCVATSIEPVHNTACAKSVGA